VLSRDEIFEEDPQPEKHTANPRFDGTRTSPDAGAVVSDLFVGPCARLVHIVSGTFDGFDDRRTISYRRIIGHVGRPSRRLEVVLHDTARFVECIADFAGTGRTVHFGNSE